MYINTDRLCIKEIQDVKILKYTKECESLFMTEQMPKTNEFINKPVVIYNKNKQDIVIGCISHITKIKDGWVYGDIIVFFNFIGTLTITDYKINQLGLLSVGYFN